VGTFNNFTQPIATIKGNAAVIPQALPSEFLNPTFFWEAPSYRDSLVGAGFYGNDLLGNPMYGTIPSRNSAAEFNGGVTRLVAWEGVNANSKLGSLDRIMMTAVYQDTGGHGAIETVFCWCFDAGLGRLISIATTGTGGFLGVTNDLADGLVLLIGAPAVTWDDLTAVSFIAQPSGAITVYTLWLNGEPAGAFGGAGGWQNPNSNEPPTIGLTYAPGVGVAARPLDGVVHAASIHSSIPEFIGAGQMRQFHRALLERVRMRKVRP